MSCNPNFQSCLTTGATNQVSQSLDLAHDPINAIFTYAKTAAGAYVSPSYNAKLVSQTKEVAKQSVQIANTTAQQAVQGTTRVYDDFKSVVGKGVSDAVDNVTSTIAHAETAVLRTTQDLSTELANIGKSATGAVVDVMKIPDKIAAGVTGTISNAFEDLKKFAIIGIALLGAVFYWSRNHILPAMIMLAAVVLVFITPGIPDEIIVGALGIVSLVADKVL